MRITARAGLLFLLAALPAPAARAQLGSFGQNKIQYRTFDWRVLRGDHVDLYFYPQEEELARVALAYAEQSYGVLEARFRHAVTRRIPLIIYASHQDFEQTNVLPFVPPEGLLGVTEFLKRRVALPFTGSYADFRHTIRHELTHVFELSATELTVTLHPRQRRAQLPLWWQEGLAEYFSAGEDTRDDMVLRDLTTAGRLPTIAQFDWETSAIVYPLGGTLVRFLAERYGEWRIVQVYDDLWKYGDFETLMQGVFGRTLDQLTAEWHLAMRRRYYGFVSRQEPLEISATRVAALAIKPAVWTPPGDTVPQVLYLSPRTGYTNVYAAPLIGGRSRTVVAGERTAQFESFHAFESRLDVSPRGVLAFTSKYEERDALMLWDLARGAVVGRYQFPDIVAILSPAWSPDGLRIAFAGLTLAGYSDLYLLDLPSGRLDRLTQDRYEDRDPSFAPDGRQLVFSSDRTATGPDGGRNLFVLDLDSRAVRYLTYGPWQDDSPRWDSTTGRIIFTSDRRGVFDVYTVDSTGAGRRESAVPGGAFDAVWVPSRGKYVFGGFEGLSYNVYALSPAADSTARDSVRLAATPEPAGAWRWAELDDGAVASASSGRYREHYSLDFAAGEALVSPGYAAAQGATFLVSDMLGDHLIYASMLAYQQGNSLSDIVSNFNGTALYLDQSRRLNWGVGAFRFRGLFFEGDFDQIFQETSVGGFLDLRYPLSRFARVEAQFRLEHSDRVDFGFVQGGGLAGFPRRRGVLASNWLSWVHDNSLWLPTGPIDGSRTNLTAGLVSDLSNARFDSWVLSADLRRYLRTGLRTAFALRGYAWLSGGARPQRITVGGSYALRGYPRFAYVAGSRALLGNLEWRFPLTDYLSIGFPVGEFRLPGVEGAFFGDLGKAWTEGQYRAFLGAWGLGLRMSLGAAFVLRLDIGRRFALGDPTSYSLPPLDFRWRRHGGSDLYGGGRFVDFWFGFDY
jgi:Tol biopolymer transport system component